MEVKIYEQEKAKYKNSEIVEGVFREFNQKEDKISDFKLVFILQNGEYLLMPYLHPLKLPRSCVSQPRLQFLPRHLRCLRMLRYQLASDSMLRVPHRKDT